MDKGSTSGTMLVIVSPPVEEAETPAVTGPARVSLQDDLMLPL